MKALVLAVASFLLPATASLAQGPPAAAIPASGHAPNGYRLTKDTGQAVLIASYEKVGKFYQYLGQDGKNAQLFETSVRTIEPITDEEAQREKPGRDQPDRDEVSGARTSARSLPRSTARTSARSKPPVYEPQVTFAPVSAGGSGGVHVGPRGGVYHYSASGKKVYHKR